jgi:hypothetical protein
MRILRIVTTAATGALLLAGTDDADRPGPPPEWSSRLS